MKSTSRKSSLSTWSYCWCLVLQFGKCCRCSVCSSCIVVKVEVYIQKLFIGRGQSGSHQ